MYKLIYFYCRFYRVNLIDSVFLLTCHTKYLPAKNDKMQKRDSRVENGGGICLVFPLDFSSRLISGHGDGGKTHLGGK